MLAARMVTSPSLHESSSRSPPSRTLSLSWVSSHRSLPPSTPLHLRCPASTVWTWFIGSCFNMTLGLSIAELVSAYPSAGGLYSASVLLVPRNQRAFVAWLTGWLNFTGQIAGIAGTEYGLSQMIFAWAYVITNGRYVASTGATVGLYIALLALQVLSTASVSRHRSSYVVVRHCQPRHHHDHHHCRSCQDSHPRDALGLVHLHRHLERKWMEQQRSCFLLRSLLCSVRHD